MGAVASTSCTSIALRGWGLLATSSKAARTRSTEWSLENSPSPIGRVTLPVTFADASNCRTETLVFEVVDFSGPYYIILGRPCYVKFMAIPSYTYLQLKIPEPSGVITVEAKT
jgi:hypothetical protein